MTHYVYEVHSRVSGGVYVGASVDPDARWTQHVAESPRGEGAFYKALREDGVKNFDLVVVSDHETKSDAVEAERERTLFWRGHGKKVFNRTYTRKRGEGRPQAIVVRPRRGSHLERIQTELKNNMAEKLHGWAFAEANANREKADD